MRIFVKQTGALLIVCAALLTTGPVFAQAPALDTLSLRGAETLLLQKNRELQAARRAVDGAAADVITAGARPNPSLSISSTNISRHMGSGTLLNKPIDTVIGISQLFERGNKAELRTETARGIEGAVQKDRDDIERTLRLALHGAYYDLAQAQEKVRMTAENAALFQKSIDALNIRLKAGDVAAVDVSRMNVDALRAQNDARAARGDLEKAQVALAYLIGAEKDAARIAVTDPLPQPDGMPPRADDAALQAAIDARPDVQAARARLAAAGKARELARSLRTRDITAGVQYERFPTNDPRGSVGFSVSVPLFLRYQYDGEIRRADSDALAAEDAVERVSALARTELRKAAADLAASGERVRRSNEVLLGAAQKAAQGAEFAYTRGAIGVMDVLDARRQLSATRLEALAVHTDYAKALSAWNAAMGTSPQVATPAVAPTAASSSAAASTSAAASSPAAPATSPPAGGRVAQ